VSTTASAFHIDTEVAPVYIKDLLEFTYEHYLLPHRENFVNVRKTIVDGKYGLSFRAIDPGMKWHVDVQMTGGKPIEVKITSGDASVPEAVLDRLKEDLIIAVQLFEEKVRKTTLYFAWVKGEDIIPETMPSAKKRATRESSPATWPTST